MVEWLARISMRRAEWLNGLPESVGGGLKSNLSKFMYANQPKTDELYHRQLEENRLAGGLNYYTKIVSC